MNCPKCGAKIGDATVCPNCGAVQQSAPTKKKHNALLFGVIVPVAAILIALASFFLLIYPHAQAQNAQPSTIEQEA
jgi:hypothetical protein